MVTIQKANTAKEKPVTLSWGVFALACVFILSLLGGLVGMHSLKAAKLESSVNQKLGLGLSFIERVAKELRNRPYGERQQELMQDAPQLEGLSYKIVPRLNNITRSIEERGVKRRLAISAEELSEVPSILLRTPLASDAYIYDSLRLEHPDDASRVYALSRLTAKAALSGLSIWHRLCTYLLAVSLWVLLLYCFRHPLLHGKTEEF